MHVYKGNWSVIGFSCIFMQFGKNKDLCAGKPVGHFLIMVDEEVFCPLLLLPSLCLKSLILYKKAN